MGALSNIFGGAPEGPSKEERDRQAALAADAERDRLSSIQEGLGQQTRRRAVAATNRRSLTGNFASLLRGKLGG